MKVTVKTPSRRIAGRKVASYDDRFILRLATDEGGVVVSNDNFRDLIKENPGFHETVKNRRVPFAFAKDK